jgi:hypothetical protein
MAKSPEQMAQTMIDNMPEKTGKSLQQWLPIVANTEHTKHGQIVRFLKSDHGVTHGFANLIAQQHLAGSAPTATGDSLILAQYSGPKASLKPIYDSVSAVVTKLGPDAEISPKKGYVSFRRKKQFALIQASTKSRVDLGINVKGHSAQGRLEAAGSFNAMVSHRVRLEKPQDVNGEVKKWLRQAYEAA